jgi:ADP-heptose:LPS heptosyltransferase
MSSRQNILLIRFKSIGDVVLTLPAAHVVRENFPSAKITFLTSNENAPLLRGFRDVSEVITLDRSALRSGNPLKMAGEFFGLSRRLRAGKFSLVVDFQGYGETGWLARLTGAPQRWGSVYGPGRAWVYTRGIQRNDRLHLADWNLSLLEQCGLKMGRIQNEFDLPEEAVVEARKFFPANNLDAARPTLFIQPFTSSPQKNWPLENFLALARYFQSRGTQIVFGGGPSEQGALEPVRAAGFPISAGMPLLTAAGVMRLSTVIIGGVTGLLHLAVALQKRVVMLVNSPATETGLPYQHKDWIVATTDGAALSKLEPETVIAACAQAFNESAGNASC